MNRDEILKEAENKMEKAIAILKNNLQGIRAGRASVNFLDPVIVEAYGSKMPVNQVANINVPEARTIVVQVWDKGLVKAVEKAISNAGLGASPQTEGQNIRINLPALSEERRGELVKLCSKYGEQSKISIRNVRRDGMDHIKKLEKDGEVSKDDAKILTDKMQKLTDEHIRIIDDCVNRREKEIINA